MPKEKDIEGLPQKTSQQVEVDVRSPLLTQIKKDTFISIRRFLLEKEVDRQFKQLQQRILQVLNLIAENEQFRKQTNQIQQQDKTRVLYEDQFTSQHQELLNQLDRLTGELNHLYSQLNLIQGRQVSLFSLARGIWDRVISDFLLDKEAVIDALSDLLEGGTETEKMVAEEIIKNHEKISQRYQETPVLTESEYIEKFNAKNLDRIREGKKPIPATPEALADGYLEYVQESLVKAIVDVSDIGQENIETVEKAARKLLPTRSDLISATNPDLCEKISLCGKHHLSLCEDIIQDEKLISGIELKISGHNEHLRTGMFLNFKEEFLKKHSSIEQSVEAESEPAFIQKLSK